MRIFLFLAVLLLGVLSFSSVRASSLCATCVAGDPCSALGTTTRDPGPTDTRPRVIVACLKDPVDGASTVGENSCASGAPCRWKAIGNESKSKVEVVSAEDIIKFHTSCKNNEVNLINCSSACSRYCMNSCVTQRSQSSYINCNHGDSGLSYLGGLFVAWTKTSVKCLCYD